MLKSNVKWGVLTVALISLFVTTLEKCRQLKSNVKLCALIFAIVTTLEVALIEI